MERHPFMSNGFYTRKFPLRITIHLNIILKNKIINSKRTETSKLSNPRHPDYGANTLPSEPPQWWWPNYATCVKIEKWTTSGTMWLFASIWEFVYDVTTKHLATYDVQWQYGTSGSLVQGSFNIFQYKVLKRIYTSHLDVS